MQLNVYLISHPLIQNLSHQIINNKQTNNYYIQNLSDKELGKLMTYEAIRKWIQSQKIYIKNLHHIKELYILNPKESYIIIADLIHSHNLVSDISILLPKSEFQHYNLETKRNTINNEYQHLSQTITKNYKIIIIIKFLENYSIITLLNYLLLEKNAKLNQICIICITCKNIILDKIGIQYPNLKIYTTKIINI